MSFSDTGLVWTALFMYQSLSYAVESLLDPGMYENEYIQPFKKVIMPSD